MWGRYPHQTSSNMESYNPVRGLRSFMFASEVTVTDTHGNFLRMEPATLWDDAKHKLPRLRNYARKGK